MLEIEKLILWFHVDNICAPRMTPFFVGERKFGRKPLLVDFFSSISLVNMCYHSYSSSLSLSLIKTYSYSNESFDQEPQHKVMCHCHKQTKNISIALPRKAK